ncbi:MAG: ATP-dependent sacrificial sulfur transferase LarE [bacterium]|nr:ATP-dependent sacrificial sulfur transferase LarE [bacterium]MDD5354429.1 ATP-dependent sacrificial sulfur transferase LarE [bacterium]MDD5755937.1 ATP-dependent sacrificial sulfur transferase LarE [bacterium]
MSPGKDKQKKLTFILLKMDKVLIAFSGGVDSTFLVYLANQILPGKVLAVTAVSETYPVKELKEAKVLAKKIGIRHLVIKTRELKNKKFKANTTERCYYCKKELFSTLKKIAAKHKIEHVVDAANIDDLKDYRPGSRASRELGIRHPLQEAGLTKKDIRQMSRRASLPTWNKPALACLASRIPYGYEIKGKNLARIDQAEEFLRTLKLRQVRVRDYGRMARIEVEPAGLPEILKNRKKVIRYFKQLGYLYITLDLAGYRMGSLNEELKKVRGSRVHES